MRCELEIFTGLELRFYRLLVFVEEWPFERFDERSKTSTRRIFFTKEGTFFCKRNGNCDRCNVLDALFPLDCIVF